MPVLHRAVEHEQLDMIRLLVEHGADVYLSNQGGWTPLMHAVDLEGDSHGNHDVNQPPFSQDFSFSLEPIQHSRLGKEKLQRM